MAKELTKPQIPQVLDDTLAAGAAAATAARASQHDDAELAIQAVSAPPPPQRPPARITHNQDGTTCRPPAGTKIATLGVVVIGNWIGSHEGKPVRVCHGTPVLDLPRALVEKIRATRGQRVGPYPPAPPSA
jgi:hypothetical protein